MVLRLPSLLLHLSSQVHCIQPMILHTLVHIGDSPTIPPWGSFRHSSRQGSDTPPRKRLGFWDDSLANEVQTSSHRQHRNDQRGDEEYSLIPLARIMDMWGPASSPWSHNNPLLQGLWYVQQAWQLTPKYV